MSTKKKIPFSWRDLEREKHSFKVSGVSTASNLIAVKMIHRVGKLKKDSL
jgi:hypothetical protein